MGVVWRGRSRCMDKGALANVRTRAFFVASRGACALGVIALGVCSRCVLVLVA